MNKQTYVVKPVLNRREMADYLGISLGTLDALTRKGLPHIRLGDGKSGGMKRFRVEEVMMWLNTQREMKK